jgi:hypothetical protein
MISINGGALTTSYPSALSLTTDATGFASFTLTTVGFGADHSITMRAKAGAITKYITMTTKDVDYSIATTFDNYKTGAGAATGVPFVVTDQWGERPAASEQLRVLLTKGDGGGSKFGFATTLSYATLTNGAVEVAFTPEPAAAVGAATLQATLQKYNSTLNSWVATGDTVTANINVSNASDAFDGSYVDSYSVSVSYWPNTVSYVTVNGSTNNTGSSVVVTGTGLIFRDSSGNTFSDGITVRGGTLGAYSFDVSGMLAGSYTLRMSTGTATTTSLLIVDPPAANSGKSITWDTTSITAGKTAIVTGKVVDMNGNGVDTTYGAGTPVIVVTFAGTAGIPVGSMPTETDADGNFRVSVLTSANDRGSLVLTAAYLKSGANTPAAQQISSVNSITVGPATASASSDQKITVGSFKGFVAIYTLGYTGQKLSAKVAGKWLVKDDLSRFERVVRNTGAGYTIKVDLYIDGAFVRSETVTTK